MAKKKFMLSVLVSFVTVSLVVVATSCIVSLVSGYGLEFALACLRLMDGWVFGVLLLSALSLIDRIKEGDITAQYIVGIVLAVISCISFFVAVTASTLNGFVSAAATAVLMASCAIAVPRIISYCKRKADLPDVGGKADGSELSFEDFEIQWARVRSRLVKCKTDEKKIEILERTLLFAPQGMSIYNNLDFSAPLLENKETKEIYTVAAASGKGIFTDDEINGARETIRSLIRKEEH